MQSQIKCQTWSSECKENSEIDLLSMVIKAEFRWNFVKYFRISFFCEVGLISLDFCIPGYFLLQKHPWFTSLDCSVFLTVKMQIFNNSCETHTTKENGNETEWNDFWAKTRNLHLKSIKSPGLSRKGPQVCFQDEFKDESSVRDHSPSRNHVAKAENISQKLF